MIEFVAEGLKNREVAEVIGTNEHVVKREPPDGSRTKVMGIEVFAFGGSR